MIEDDGNTEKMFYGESENWRKKDLIAGGNKIIAVGFFYLQSLQYYMDLQLQVEITSARSLPS